jgi:hypothetical protein
VLTAFSEIFKDTTLFFSRGTPNLATVIPAMDHIDKVLATSSDRHQYSLSICAALFIGKNTINRYYHKTDHSETYRIAMGTYYLYSHLFNFFIYSTVLHPRHKIAYFKAQGWEEAWIDTAYNIVCKEYDCSYASACFDGDSNEDYIAVGSVDLVSILGFLLCSLVTYSPQSMTSLNNIFDNLPELAPASSDICDELELYLSTDTEDVKDGILWWHERCATFPCLSRMARNYLSIPGKCLFYISLLIIYLLFFKRLQSMLNARLVKANSSFLMSAAASLSTQCVCSCASACGVHLISSRIAM